MIGRKVSLTAGRTACVAVACLAVAAAGCGVVSEGESPATSDLAAEVREACERTVRLHDEIATIFNDLSGVEVDATETERAELLADGLDAMIDAVADGELASSPAQLVVDLEERRSAVVADMRTEAAAFRATWQRVTVEDRPEAVPRLLVFGEKLMSETEPRLGASASPELIAAVEATPECRHVIQT